ncbi:MAG TPA: hypothetical protein VNI61_04830, partial [Gemmatimonadales bacterium]|nr:hypothetical protein [Gemmatimonadales bacterium]
MRVKVFRWRAIGPLLVFALVGGVLWVLFAEELARRTSEDAGTELVGARVEIRRLDLDLGQGDVTLRGVTVGSPFDPMRNLLEAEELVADLDPLPLLEKKLVIDRLAARGLRFGTARTTPGFDSTRPRSGRAGAVMREVKDWARRFDVPVLRLARGGIDVGRLDPARLESVRAAAALAARADSGAGAWRGAVAALDVEPV